MDGTQYSDTSAQPKTVLRPTSCVSGHIPGMVRRHQCRVTGGRVDARPGMALTAPGSARYTGQSQTIGCLERDMG